MISLLAQLIILFFMMNKIIVIINKKQNNKITKLKSIMKIPKIPCNKQNHYKMPLQYICINQNCIKINKQLSCIYCCQQLHSTHLQFIQTLKQILDKFYLTIKNNNFNLSEILFNGIFKCKNQNDLKINLQEIFAFQKKPQRFLDLIDSKNMEQYKLTQEFYQRKIQNNDLQQTVKKKNKSTQHSINNFICPILTFSSEDALHQKCRYLSPFCISNEQQQLTTIFAYPSINRFNQSIQSRIKIQRITPFWLGIGLSFGKYNYETGSKNHIMLISNGWISIFGNLFQTTIRYYITDIVRIRIDKSLSLVQFYCNTQRYIVPLQFKWDQDIYICCSIYYKDDCVQILTQ